MLEYLDNWLHKRFTHLGWRVFSHVLFWLVFFGSLTYVNSISFNAYRGTPLVYLNPLRNTLSLLFIYYPLVYGVGQRLLSNKKWVTGTLAILGLLLAYTLIDYGSEAVTFTYCQECRETLLRIQPNYHYYLSRGFWTVVSSRVVSLGTVFGLLMYIMPVIALKVGLAYHRQYVQNLKLSRDNIQLELNFLKAQVNPHFLFNTLNNLYGLIIHGRNEQSAETVARLSDFMRYALYESMVDKIALEKEISLIKNYLELEKLRLNHTQVVFNCTVDSKTYTLPPLLFMPVIENAFKYNADTAQGSAIEINLTAQDNSLQFSVQNTFEPRIKKDKVGGIGLVNLQKRLALYFPGKSTYEAQSNGFVYSTQITLSLA